MLLLRGGGERDLRRGGVLRGETLQRQNFKKLRRVEINKNDILQYYKNRYYIESKNQES